MKIAGLKTNYQENPLGIALENIALTWEYADAKGNFLKSVRVQVSDSEDFSRICYDSEKDPENLQADISLCTPEAVFVPGKPYFWRVLAGDDAGDSAVSPVAAFEGGHPEGEWKGQWIAPTFTPELHPVMRKTFALSAAELDSLTSGRLYICGLGLYEAYLNGQKIGEEYLTPYFTDYRYWTQYQTFDVGSLLKEGENTLDVWLGNGWYKGRFGYLANGQLRNYYGSEFKLLADLFLKGKDGERVIGTDESWVCLKSPVVISGIYDGEVYDARQEAALAAPGKRDLSPVRRTEAPDTSLTAMTGPGVLAHEQLQVKEFIHTPAGEQVLDFGQEVTGWVTFAADAPEDTRITLEYGEVLQDGCFYRDNLRTAEARFVYISAGGGKKTIRPHFTYYGFRYVKVTGIRLSEEAVTDFTAVCLYSDIAPTGHLTTGNEKVNRLIENTLWSEKDNFLDIPTDCPQRDEREGWTGDAQIFANTASYHMQTPAFFRKYLKDMAFEQTEKDGAVPYVVPDVLTVGREKMAEPPFDFTEDLWGEAGAAVWGDAATIIPWTMYSHFGNRKWLAEAYPNMKQWADFIIHMDEDCCGGKHLWTCGFHFGDWLSLDVEGDTAGMANREGGTDKHFVASVYYMYSTALTAKAASLLGLKEDAAYYERISGEVREAVRKAYFTSDGLLTSDTQTAYVIALHFGLFNGEEEKKAGAAQLARLVHKWKDHLATGFVGTAFICSALTAMGFAKEAFTLLLNEDYPSWLYEVNLGATTIWERWNSLLPDGHISGTGMNSLNHYAYGSVAGFLYEDVCGLKVEAECPGGSQLLLAPHTDERLGKAEAAVKLPAGEYTSGWEIEEGGRVAYRFTVPFNGRAAFRPDRPLRDITLNGEPCTEKELLNREFSKGNYEVKAKII